MRIQSLKPSQRVQGRWLVQLEDGSLLRVGEGEVVTFSLYEGKELTPEETRGLSESVRQSGFWEYALNLLTSKPMSRRELERKLAQREASEEEVLSICHRLEELSFLDDARYAETVVRHYAKKGYGERKLRDELYRRGVPREYWDEALEQVEDTGAAIDAFIQKKLKGVFPVDQRELKRVSDALARRGYSWSDISQALRRYGAQWED